jgi:hypothetical protein
VSRKLYDRLWGFDTGMLVYGAEDVDFGVKAWLMGYPVLHDPAPVIGHRFRPDFDAGGAPWEHMLANQLRMGRKTFSDAAWFDWVDRFSARHPAGVWEAGWRRFVAGHESIERERAYLMANRVRDEFWYARTFGQGWPASPSPVAGPDTPRPPAPPSVSLGPPVFLASSSDPAAPRFEPSGSATLGAKPSGSVVLTRSGSVALMATRSGSVALTPRRSGSFGPRR